MFCSNECNIKYKDKISDYCCNCEAILNKNNIIYVKDLKFCSEEWKDNLKEYVEIEQNNNYIEEQEECIEDNNINDKVSNEDDYDPMNDF